MWKASIQIEYETFYDEIEFIQGEDQEYVKEQALAIAMELAQDNKQPILVELWKDDRIESWVGFRSDESWREFEIS